MEILSISINPILFLIVASVLIAVIVLVVIVKKDREADLEEINEILEERKEKVEPVEEVEEIDNKVHKNQADLENLLSRMQEDLEAKPTDVITHFENDQEENSIISYQELVDTLKSENKIEETKELLKKDVVKEEVEVEGKVEPIKTEVQTDLGEITKVEIPEVKEKKFKNTEFISPIFGVLKSKTEKKTRRYSGIDDIIISEEASDNKTLIEENIELEPLREEIKRNDEFLQALKEFRKNL